MFATQIEGNRKFDRLTDKLENYELKCIHLIDNTNQNAFIFKLHAELISSLEIEGKKLIQKHYISNIIYENIGKRRINITFQTLYTLNIYIARTRN